MNKIEKLLLELVKISYANMVFNTLLAKVVAAQLCAMASSPKSFDEDMDEAYKTIDEYISSLEKVMEG